MSRISVFIDGFNLYHALVTHPSYHKYKWLNLKKFSECFIGPKDSPVDIFYFTAYTTWNQDKLKRHQLYVKALQYSGVKVILGAFRRKDQRCRLCHKAYKTHEEKRTDVNIAIKLFETAIEDTWEKALIISGDSDLIPAIESVKKMFPAKEIGVVIPIGRPAKELTQATDFRKKVKVKHLETCQFNDVLTIDQSRTLSRPASWK